MSQTNGMFHGGSPRRCDACQSPNLKRIMDLGLLPASDGFLSGEQLPCNERRAPLKLARCGRCGLLMLEDRLPPAELFGADYLYSGSVSVSLREHFQALAESVTEEAGLQPGDSVIEVASNDGFLLQAMQERGLDVLGVEPAPYPARLARARGVKVLQRFFDVALAREMRARGHAPRVVIATNVLAHNPALDDFAEALATLTDVGLLIIEVPYLGDLLDRLAFDTIYHEHVFYFSLSALSHLFARQGLTIARLERIAAQGGSLRLYLRRGASQSESVDSLLAEEDAGSLSVERVRAFVDRVEALRKRGRALCQRLKAEGRRIAAYGAAAKGTILLNHLGLDGSLLDYVVDGNPEKQGRWVPGVRLPIVGRERLASDPPDHLLILPWNLASEIRTQEAAWERAGGRFILPLPDFEILQ